MYSLSQWICKHLCSVACRSVLEECHLHMDSSLSQAPACVGSLCRKHFGGHHFPGLSGVGDSDGLGLCLLSGYSCHRGEYVLSPTPLRHSGLFTHFVLARILSSLKVRNLLFFMSSQQYLTWWHNTFLVLRKWIW